MSRFQLVFGDVKSDFNHRNVWISWTLLRNMREWLLRTDGMNNVLCSLFSVNKIVAVYWKCSHRRPVMGRNTSVGQDCFVSVPNLRNHIPQLFSQALSLTCSTAVLGTIFSSTKNMPWSLHSLAFSDSYWDPVRRTLRQFLSPTSLSCQRWQWSVPCLLAGALFEGHSDLEKLTNAPYLLQHVSNKQRILTQGRGMQLQGLLADGKLTKRDIGRLGSQEISLLELMSSPIYCHASWSLCFL